MSKVLDYQAHLKPKTSTNTTVDYYVPRGSADSPSTTLIQNFPNRFPETEREIYDLANRREGWDGYEAPRPNLASIARARSWAEQLYRDVRAELWLKPHVSSDEGGDVSFEWWKGQRKLTIYVSPREVEYIKVEKVGSSLKMEDGSVDTDKERGALWRWLIS